MSLAWFADTQYQKKVDFMSSSTYENKEALMKKAKVRNYYPPPSPPLPMIYGVKHSLVKFIDNKQILRTTKV